jgi:hypothetical protein
VFWKSTHQGTKVFCFFFLKKEVLSSLPTGPFQAGETLAPTLALEQAPPQGERNRQGCRHCSYGSSFRGHALQPHCRGGTQGIFLAGAAPSAFGQAR